MVPFCFPSLDTSIHIPIFEKPVNERVLILNETPTSAVFIAERGPIKLELSTDFSKICTQTLFPACNWLLAIIKLLAYFIFKMLFTWQWLNLEWISEVFDSKKLISNMKLWFINAGLCKKNVIQNIKLWLNYILKYKEVFKLDL